MHSRSHALSFLVVLAAGGGVSPEPGPAARSSASTGDGSETRTAVEPTYQNPVVDENCPDPGVLAHDGAFWAVCTTNDNQVPDRFPIRRSSDLVSWTLVGHLLPAGTAAWPQRDFWAPEIHAIGEGFVAYYTARDGGGRLSIGVATAREITGPWAHTAAPLIRDARVGMIDPHQFQDADGTRYLFWKADGNDFRPPEPTPIYGQRLSADGLTLVGERTTILRNDAAWEGPVIEGGSIVARDGWYYLIYSGNVFNSDRYAVGVARARSPLGPYEKHGEPILGSDEAFVGPGHGSIVTAADGTDYYVYHAWRPGRVDPAWDRPSFPRVMLVDRITWSDGWPAIHDRTPSTAPMPVPGPPPPPAPVLAPP
jgi:arabinan endo-1,5-alpha-L-arabinosidase